MDPEGTSGGRLAELRSSARGWHGVQLAVLGFIGLCGVLQGDAGADNPRWLQVLAGVLVLAALALACAATALVASAAWPVYGGGSARADGSGDEIRRTSRRLRAGIVLTFVAVVVLAVAAASSWWPSEGGAAGSAVEVTTSSGVACGQLVPDRPGLVRLDVGGRSVVVSLDDVVSLRLRDSCG